VNEQPSNVDRSFQRRRVIKGGMIAYNLRRITVPCVVRDLSVAGARLQVESPENVPNTFDLLIELDGFEVECETMWREGKQIGVRFLAEPTVTAPKRVQVVNSSDQAPTPSIRLAERKREFQPAPDQAVAGDAFRPMQEPQFQVPSTQQPPVQHSPVHQVPIQQAPIQQASAQQPPLQEPRVQEPRVQKPLVDLGSSPKGSPILIMEDEPRGQILFEEAFKVDPESPPFEFVGDGRELMQYLAGEGRFAGKPRPGMVVLDIDAPGTDHRAILQHIKSAPGLAAIPVVAMSRSNADHDIENTYGFDIGSFVQKPDNIMGMVEMTKTLTRFWNTFADPGDTR